MRLILTLACAGLLAGCALTPYADRPAHEQAAINLVCSKDPAQLATAAEVYLAYYDSEITPELRAALIEYEQLRFGDDVADLPDLDRFSDLPEAGLACAFLRI